MKQKKKKIQIWKTTTTIRGCVLHFIRFVRYAWWYWLVLTATVYLWNCVNFVFLLRLAFLIVVHVHFSSSIFLAYFLFSIFFRSFSVWFPFGCFFFSSSLTVCWRVCNIDLIAWCVLGPTEWKHSDRERKRGKPIEKHTERSDTYCQHNKYEYMRMRQRPIERTNDTHWIYYTWLSFSRTQTHAHPKR